MLPAGAVINKAMLRLYVDAVVQSGSFEVYQLDNTWSEVSKLLASTGATVGTYTVGSSSSGIAFDGANIWVASYNGGSVTELPAFSRGLNWPRMNPRVPAQAWLGRGF